MADVDTEATTAQIVWIGPRDGVHEAIEAMGLPVLKDPPQQHSLLPAVYDAILHDPWKVVAANMFHVVQDPDRRKRYPSHLQGLEDAALQAKLNVVRVI
jgi:hypothetical protein